MKRVVEDVFDDIEYEENNHALVQASHSLTLIVRENGGEVSTDIDLSEKNHHLFWQEQQRWFNAGHESVSDPNVIPVPKQRKRLKGNSQSEAIFRNRQMRAFGDANGIPYVKNKDGTYSYPKRLLDEFAEHEKNQTVLNGDMEKGAKLADRKQACNPV